MESDKNKAFLPLLKETKDGCASISIKGHITFIDEEDIDRVIARRWHCKISKNGSIYFINTSKKHGKLKDMPLHRFVLKVDNNDRTIRIDHKDGNTLDNRKCNLRVCTNSQNMCNRGKTVLNKSGYKGVNWYKRGKKWRAKICLMGKHYHLGYFDTKEEACYAYNEAAKKYHGEYARLNELKYIPIKKEKIKIKIKQIAKIVGYTPDTVRKFIRELWPNLMKPKVPTYLDKYQEAAVIEKINLHKAG